MLPGIQIGYRTERRPGGTENQDSLFVPAGGAPTADRGVLIAVADGMGGQAGGALASRTAVEALAALYAESTGQRPVDQLALLCVEQAHARIRELGADLPAQEAIGTTLTVALIRCEEVTIFHVGDSRAYLFRDGGLKLLTRDHTLAQRWADRHVLRTPPRNPGPMGKSVLTRAVGVGKLHVDRYDYRIALGDRLLLASDGLHGVLQEPRLIQGLGTAKTAWDAAHRLIAFAQDAGAWDDATAVVAAVG